MGRIEITMMVARNIEQAMARKGTGPAEVARRAKINPTGVYDILKGKSANPRLDTIHKIAVEGLGIPMAALFMEPNDEELDQELCRATRKRIGPSARRKFTGFILTFHLQLGFFLLFYLHTRNEPEPRWRIKCLCLTSSFRPP